MSDEIIIDTKKFGERINKLRKRWQDLGEAERVDAIVLLAGDQNEQEPYTKTKAMHNWLLGYEFPRTLLIIEQDKVYMAASTKKAQLLEQLKAASNIVGVELVTLPKDEEGIGSKIKEMVEKSLGGKGGKTIVGRVLKEKAEGKFADQVNKILAEKVQTEQIREVGQLLGRALCVKDSDEIEFIKLASDSSSKMMNGYFVDTMVDLVDSETKITHEELSEKVENAVFDNKVAKKIKLSDKLDREYVEWSFSPIIQSGKEFNLSVSALSNNRKLEGSGIILCSLGMRYNMYCSGVGRTYLIDPSKTQEKNYEFLEELQKYKLGIMKAGETFSGVYEKLVKYIREKRGDLEGNFIKSCGFVSGIEFRDGTFVINTKCKEKLEAGMVIYSMVGFNNLKEGDKTYGLQLNDTVLIGEKGAEKMTKCPTDLNETSFYFNEQEEDEAKKKKEQANKQKQRQRQGQNAILTSKFRSENAEEAEESQFAKRLKHQAELKEELQRRGEERFRTTGSADDNKQSAEHKEFVSYKRETGLPAQTSRLQLMVDQRHESILVPINGVAVPFNIRTLKNISKSDEGETTFLRLNFITPGAGAAVASNKQELSFIRSLTFKSSDILRFSELYNEINALKKDQVKREQEKSTMADIVEQDKLIEVRNTRPTRLADVFIRPGPDNKRIPGGLEIHKNGLRYVHPVRQHSVDLLFNNIKHMIFQPSKHELVVLLHFHLKNPIMLGKKKVYDVQFCKEVSDSAFDETGNRKRRFTRYGDEDEIQAEIDERINRDRLDKLFKAFAEAVAEQSNNLIDLDIPFYDASFMGVPLRSRVRLQPTVDCLVHLSDPPFFLVSISDIELVHLERVQFGLKNFDFVIVFKDYKKTPVHVNTVPIEQLDDVKEWLDSVNIPFSEGPVNLNWSQIMKTINDSPRDFFLDGGWSFLGDTPLSDDENDSPSESEFELDEDEDNDQSSDDYSDSDDDGDAYSSDESESTPDDDDDEEEGDDWDTLDRKARQYDERHTRGNFFAPTNKRAKVSNSSADSNRRPPPKKSFSRR